ncbi:MAG: hypothetical protein AAF849_05600 [Bacteroidota bacterium]
MDQIRQLVGEGKLDDALKELLPLALPYSSEITILQGRLNKLNRDSRSGILHYTEENIQHAKLSNDLLALIKAIQENPAGENTGKVVSNSPSSQAKKAPVNACPKCFLMYDFDDKEQVVKLKKFLHLFVRSKKIELFDMHEYDFGADQDAEIEQHLASSDYVFCLITFMFLFTTYEWAEKARAMNKRIIPIKINVVGLEETFLKNLRMLPSNRKAVAEWKNEDAAYADIVANLKKLF